MRDMRSPRHGTAGLPGPGTRRGIQRRARTAPSWSPRRVVGNAVDDAEPRSAPGAVGKAIAVASLRRVEDLARAFGTDRGIGSDLGACRPGGTFDDPEARRARTGRAASLDPFDMGKRRRLPPDPIEQRGNRTAAARDADQHALGVVPHVTGQAELAGHPPDGGPKPHPLHTPANSDLRNFHSDPAPRPDRTA